MATNAIAQQGRDARIESVGAGRWAVLVGVDSYKHISPDLGYCGADVLALGDRLVQAGFHRDCVVVLSDKAADSDYHPTKANIEKQLRLTLESVGPGDFVFLGFSGHGVRLDGKSYLCPRDAKMDAADLLAVDDIYKRLGDCRAKFKLFLVDACQNDKSMPKELVATRAADEIKEFDLSVDDKLPAGILLMTSCSAGQKSVEEPKFGHGVFTYFLLEGLAGRADADQNGEVSLLEWSGYASSRTRAYVRSLDRAQSPAMRGEFPDFDFAKVARIEPARIEPTVYTAWPFDGPEAKRRQEETAKAIGQPVEITNSLGVKLVLIPAGEFMMGNGHTADEEIQTFRGYGMERLAADHFKQEYPCHRVRITRPYYLGACNLTRKQFGRFIEESHYRTDAEKDPKGGWGIDRDLKYKQDPRFNWRNPGFPQNDDHPVVTVSWNDAEAFCQWLSRKEGKTYRLPTEAEWEYACRAGTTTRYYCGDAPEELVSVGNVADSSVSAVFKWKEPIHANDGYVFTSPVGRFRPNAFGLYDMHGNACQWCADWYDKDSASYPSSLQNDPVGPANPASARVFRGSAWNSRPDAARAAYRDGYAPTSNDVNSGIRIVQSP